MTGEKLFAMWFLLLLTYSFSLPSTSEAFSCHKCASERAVMNWSRYGLPMQQGDSMEGDDSCLHEEKLQDGVHCPGLCMTVNVTAASGPHIGKSIGIVRDCQPPVAKKKHDLKEGQNETCVTHQRTVRSNYVVNVTYCYCAGEYCNGGSSSPTQDGTHLPIILPKPKIPMTEVDRKPLHMPPLNPPPPVPSHNQNNSMLSNASTGTTATKRTSVQSQPVTSKKVDTGRVVQLNGHVGFDSLPHQLVKKAVEAGFQFNLMCVGETGMGKTTLIESLFDRKVDFEPCNNELRTVELRTKTIDLEEGGIRVKLQLVETAGFGDQLDKDKSAKVIADYLETQFERYLQEELKVRRILQFFEDTRIHACLYFISPTGHGLKALDLVTLRELAKRVNVIPVIAKADTTCKDELSRFKEKIMNELKAQKIEIYHFPTDDEAVSTLNSTMNSAIPFAVVGSVDHIIKENGQRVRARKYPWGVVEVENEQHCDFVKLREALLRTNVDEMRQRTHEVLYENYRRERMRQMKFGDGENGPKMIERMATKHKEYQDEYARKEATLREEFKKKLDDTEAEMRTAEEQLNCRAREIEDRFRSEMAQIDAEMRQLAEDKTKLMHKMSKKLKK
ncbi:unnamed protein product [Caenorhabditis auriculariae]|uniref:Septin-type G domain-containing protein n=1 Tax=Caenorhabditis auriculariae TaxID=2777116 RepID=A0A8S1GUR3_9PELO|nr:unnamed protein product [Caenorhabditis auriculariae]